MSEAEPSTWAWVGGAVALLAALTAAVKGIGPVLRRLARERAKESEPDAAFMRRRLERSLDLQDQRIAHAEADVERLREENAQLRREFDSYREKAEARLHAKNGEIAGLQAEVWTLKERLAARAG